MLVTRTPSAVISRRSSFSLSSDNGPKYTNPPGKGSVVNGTARRTKGLSGLPDADCYPIHLSHVIFITAKGTSSGIVILGGVKTFPTSFSCKQRVPEPEQYSQRRRRLTNTGKFLICSLEEMCRGKLTRLKKGLKFL